MVNLDSAHSTTNKQQVNKLTLSSKTWLLKVHSCTPTI